MGLPCTIFDGERMERKRRRRGSLPRGWRGGGSTGDGGPAAVTAGGGGAPVREVRKGGARCGEEVLMPLYRVEEEGEGARKAVGGGVRWRSARPAAELAGAHSISSSGPRFGTRLGFMWS
jgi:hypothetical protein